MSILDRMKPRKPGNPFWNRIPEQVTRLSVAFVLVIAALVSARTILVPDDFGEFGHYRGSAVAEIASQEMKYAGHYICVDCHDDVVETKGNGYHKDVSCEICHGPAAEHVEEPEPDDLWAPRERGYCVLCHEYLPARPTGFPQIVSASHNPMKPCISCHEPHDPKPPETPRECEACHATIGRTKAISHHVYIACTECHDAPEAHKISPRANRPTKPQTRKFCGGCHAKDAPSERGIPRVDRAVHGERYVCWQCHYPHLPETH